MELEVEDIPQYQANAAEVVRLTAYFEDCVEGSSIHPSLGYFVNNNQIAHCSSCRCSKPTLTKKKIPIEHGTHALRDATWWKSLSSNHRSEEELSTDLMPPASPRHETAAGKPRNTTWKLSSCIEIDSRVMLARRTPGTPRLLVRQHESQEYMAAPSSHFSHDNELVCFDLPMSDGNIFDSEERVAHNFQP